MQYPNMHSERDTKYTKVIKAIKIILPKLKWLFLIFAVILIHYTTHLAIVQGNSMYPTLKNNSLVLVKNNAIKIVNGDIVTAKIVLNSKKLEIVKRVLGVPGDHVQIVADKVYVNQVLVVENYVNELMVTDNIELVIPSEYFFVLGDNRNDSLDSRSPLIGLISKKELTGVVIFKFW